MSVAQGESDPRVSVLLPAREAASTLGDCLASIAGQSFTSWHCVVVDDGSRDGTRALAEQAAARDARFTVVSLSPSGLIPALNAGLRHCSAPLIARMDADDVMHESRLRLQVAALDADPTLGAVGSHVWIVPRASMSPRLCEYESWLNSLRTDEDVRRDAFVECPIAHPTLMMRREMAAGGYEDHGWPEDYDLVLRALAAEMRIGVVPERLLAWRDRRDGHSRVDPRYSEVQFVACKAHYLAGGFLAAHDEYVLWGYGGTGRALRRALAMHGKRPSHIIEVKPSRLGERIHGAPVVPPSALDGLRGRPLIVSVARLGPRTEIRAALASMGFLEVRDYVCSA